MIRPAILSLLFLVAACGDGAGHLQTAEEIRQLSDTSELATEPQAQETVTALRALRTATAQLAHLKQELELVLVRSGSFKASICLDCAKLPVGNSWVFWYADRSRNEVLAVVVDATGVIDLGTLTVPKDALDKWETVDTDHWQIDSDDILLPEGFRMAESMLVQQSLRLMSVHGEAVWFQMRGGMPVTVDSAERPMRYVGMSFDDDVPVAWATSDPFRSDPWKARFGTTLDERPWF